MWIATGQNKIIPFSKTRIICSATQANILSFIGPRGDALKCPTAHLGAETIDPQEFDIVFQLQLLQNSSNAVTKLVCRT
mgnify:CR=1 FL=1|jgi:hypothetical protein